MQQVLAQPGRFLKAGKTFLMVLSALGLCLTLFASAAPKASSRE